MSNAFLDELGKAPLKTYAGIILDESGSMCSAYHEIISGLKEQIESLQDGTNENMDTSIIFVTFNDNVHIHPLQNAQDFNFGLIESYAPRGMTAMLDAVGSTIEYLKRQPDIDDPNTSVLLVIASDGEENASKDYKWETIAEMIQGVKDTGRWTVTYMGANQDLSMITEKLKVDAGNVTVFDASSSQGYAKGMTMVASSTASFMACRGMGAVTMDSFYSSVKSKEEK